MRHAGWLWILAGCPWIGFQEHHDNRVALTDGADADTDADTDTDTDADTDTAGGHTGGICVDDDAEQNDFEAQAHAVTVPGTVDGTLCPDDLGEGGAPVPTDAYSAEVGPNEVLFVAVQAGATTTCADQTFTAEISLDGTVRDVGVGPCPTLVGGWGPGDYVVQLLAPDQKQQDYRLALSTAPCHDRDGDGFLAEACGGPDCDDANATLKPGQPEIYGDGLDQDCDGGDDLVGDACPVSSLGAASASGTLPCGDLDTEPVWDAWQLPANAPLSIAVRNGAGAADVLAYLVDAGGAHYGLDTDPNQFDDGYGCPESAWTGNGSACAGACIQPDTPGTPTLWVAQHDGSGCTDGATYEIVVRDGVTTLSLDTQLVDDGVLVR